MVDRDLLFDSQIDDLLDLEDLSRVLGKAPQTVRNMVAKRQIPFVRVGRTTMFLRSSIVAWLRKKEVHPWQ